MSLGFIEVLIRGLPIDIPHTYSGIIYHNDPLTGPWALPDQVIEHRTPCFVRKRISINTYGMRDKHRHRNPTQGLRIALIGDSYLQGLQVRDEQTISRQLEYILAGSPVRNPVEVLNFGVSSTGTAVQLMRYRSMVKAFQPDIVILLFTAGNDITDNHPTLKQRLDPIVASVSPYFLLDASGQLQAEITPGATSRTSSLKAILGPLIIARLAVHALNTLRTDSARAHAQAPVQPRELYAEAENITQQLLGRFAQEVHGAHSRFAVAIVPTGIYGLSEGRVDTNTPRVEAMVHNAYPHRDIPIISFATAFAEYTAQVPVPLAYPCDAHWNATAHRVAAEALAQELAQLGWLQQSPVEWIR